MRTGWGVLMAGLMTGLLTGGAVLAAGPGFECGGKHYAFEDGMFGGAAKIRRGTEWQDFCVSVDAETASQELVMRGDEVWCLTFHHITADTKPYARTSWVLNRRLGVVQQSDYIFSDGAWVRQSRQRVQCRREETMAETTEETK